MSFDPLWILCFNDLSFFNVCKNHSNYLCAYHQVHVTTTLVPRLHVMPPVTGKEQPVGKTRDNIQTFYNLPLLTLKTLK